MSVLIKGVEMPRGCLDNNGCFLFSECWHGMCVEEDDIEYYHINRLDECPLVKVSTPHGDLIDIDTIDFTNNDDTSDDNIDFSDDNTDFNEIYSNYKRAFNMGAAWAIMQVAKAKTVVDSEK